MSHTPLPAGLSIKRDGTITYRGEIIGRVEKRSADETDSVWHTYMLTLPDGTERRAIMRGDAALFALDYFRRR
jgi:hypothetical protein